MNSTLRKLALLPLLLVLVVGGGLLIRGNTGSHASEPGEQPTKAGEASAAREPTSAGDFASAEARIPETGQERRQLLETIGVLTAAHCYQTYLNIGLIAESKSKGNYSENEAHKFLDLIRSLLDSVDRKLAVLGKMDLGTDDRASLEQMRQLSELLRRQAKQLETFWDSGKDEDAAKYDDIRKDSWTAISKFTGIGR
jgi:hypothetical protein